MSTGMQSSGGAKSWFVQVELRMLLNYLNSFTGDEIRGGSGGSLSTCR